MTPPNEHSIMMTRLPNRLLSSAVHGMISVRQLRQKSLNSVTTTQYRAPIFRVVKIGLKSVKKVVMSIINLGWGT